MYHLYTSYNWEVSVDEAAGLRSILNHVRPNWIYMID